MNIEKLSPVNRTQAKLFTHYKGLLRDTEDWDAKNRETSKEYLINFCSLAIGRILNEDFPEDKAGRWLGFIQGALVSNGVTSTSLERDKTRKMFHRAYIESGKNIPKTINL